MSRADRLNRERPEEFLGRVVTSRAGRDAGTRYVVIALAEGDAVLVADGRRRGIAHPKRKNARHLAVEADGDETVRARVLRGERLSDEEIRAAVGQAVAPGGA